MTLPQEDVANVATMTLRFDRFRPPCWQVWDAAGEHLLASFATKPMLLAALPSVRSHLLGEKSRD